MAKIIGIIVVFGSVLGGFILSGGKFMALIHPFEVMIIGGGQLYAEALPRADRLYLTHIELAVEGDTHFPDYLSLGWQELERTRHPADDMNSYACEFVTLSRQR